MSDIKSYAQYIRSLVNLQSQATAFNTPKVPSSARGSGPKKIVIFSPHPDDECINGGLALRLKNENNFQVTNAALTLGSHLPRQKQRLSELESACDVLGFNLWLPNCYGFSSLKIKHRKANTQEWQCQVSIIANYLLQEKPDGIFFPHKHDFNPTHIASHYLLIDAIAWIHQRGENLHAHLFETEFWHMMENPNLMVCLPEHDVVQLIEALAQHKGEIARNPYHLRLPFRLMDNITRGSEVVQHPGALAVNAAFAAIYRHSQCQDGKIILSKHKQATFMPETPLTLLF